MSDNFPFVPTNWQLETVTMNFVGFPGKLNLMFLGFWTFHFVSSILHLLHDSGDQISLVVVKQLANSIKKISMRKAP